MKKLLKVYIAFCYYCIYIFYDIGFVITACTYICDVCLQINAVLLTISLGSLARSQLGRTSEIKSERNERRKEYLELGK